MELTEYIYYLILLAGIGIGIIKYSKLESTARVLWILLGYIFTKEICAKLLAQTLHYNLNFYQYLSPVDFILASLIFSMIPILVKYRWFFLLSGLFVFVFFFLNLFIWEPPGKGADTNFKMVRSFFLILYSLLLYYRLASFPDMKSIFQKSSFWFATGFIVFNTFTMFHWGAYNYLLHHKPTFINDILRPLYITANYILYSLLAVAVYLNSFSSIQKPTLIKHVRG